MDNLEKKKDRRGGFRPGSGPKVGSKLLKTIKKEEMREALRLIVCKYLEELVSAQIDKARGCAVVDKDDETGNKIYYLPPDPAAFKNLIEQAIGKPQSDIEISGKDGTPIVVKWIEEKDA